MSKDTSVNRRTVLKASSGSLLFGGLSSARGIRANGYDTVHLVEAGVRYSVDDSVPCVRYHVDKPTEYWVDAARNEVILRKQASSETRSLFKSARRVVNARGLASDRAPVSQRGTTTELTTEFASRYRRSESLLLAEPTKEQDISVAYSGSSPRLQIDGEDYSLPVDEEKSVSLAPTTVTARTREISDEKARIKGVDERRLGYKVNYGNAEVTVTPEIVAENHGELTVVEGVR